MCITCSFSLLKVAPPGMHQVQTMACGACSIEHGQKAMFITYQVSFGRITLKLFKTPETTKNKSVTNVYSRTVPVI